MNISITTVLLGLTAITSYMAFKDRKLFDNLKHYPVAEKRNKEYYRFVTSGFVHGSMIHLLINLFVLWQFGELAEMQFRRAYGPMVGPMVYTAMYILALIVADIPSYIKHQNNPGYSAIGASGAVSAVVFVNLLFYPWEYLWLYMIIPIPYVVGGVAYIVYSSWASKNSNDNIGHDAHLYGALFGIVFTLIAIQTSGPEFIQQFMMGPKWPTMPY